MLFRFLGAVSIGIMLLGGQTGGAHAPYAAVRFYDTAATRQYSGAYTPDQVATAYDFKPLYKQGIDGTGQTVALIEIDRFKLADVTAFDSAYRLPDLTIQQYYAGGRSFPLQKGGETTLDLEWLHALAPGAAIQIYYVPATQPDSKQWRSLASALSMASSNGANVISISLGTCGPSPGFKVTEAEFSRLEKLGVSVFVSSGDSGARPGPIRFCGRKIALGYPSGDPSVVSVGGTSLQLNDDDTIAGEKGWKYSGGGRLKPLLRPVWQSSVKLPKDKYRWAPDVSFLGDPDTGVSVMQGGNWMQAGGTSLGAPAWAAAWAVIRESATNSGQVVGTAAPLLYRIGSSSTYKVAFHDITSGSNGHYRAKPGWDAVTGWGTPDVAALATTLEAPITKR